MLDHRPFAHLGRFENDWLDAHYHFSFADYYDRRRMGVGTLRVWNDDLIRAGTGFPPHPHRDMEIVTYVRSGAITHEDSLGNQGRTAAGDVQVMSAGTGIYHSEWNAEDEDIQVFQIWITPAVRRVAPRWEQRPFPKTPGALSVLASGREIHQDSEALKIYQDAAVWGGVLLPAQPWTLPLAGRQAYLATTRGHLLAETSAGERLDLAPRDGLWVSGVETLTLTALNDAETEVVLVDVAAET